MIGRHRDRSEERTAEQRAAAAAERMRRRGVEPPPDLAVSAVPPEPAAPQPEPVPGPAEPVTPPASPQPEPEPVAPVPEPPLPDPEPDPEPVAAPRPRVIEPQSWLDPDPEEPGDPGEPETEAEADDAELVGAPGTAIAAGGAVARRAGPRAAPPRPPEGAAQRRRAAPPRPGAAGGGRRATRPPAPSRARRPVPPGARPPSRAGRRVLALIALIVIAALAWLAYKTFQPFHDEPTGTVRVTVPSGVDAGQIGRLLEGKGVVDDGTFFSINATVTGRRGGLRPGDYTLQRGMTYGAALDALTAGPKAKVVKTFKLTLPEGLSRREMAPRAAKAGVDGDYVQASGSRSALRAARRLGLPRSGKTTEGFLFPATYDLVSGADAGDLVAKQLAAFRDSTASVSYATAKRKNLTRYDVLVIASMIERETQLDRERPLVSAVIYNRLKDGMPLGIDATIRYAENNWTRPLRVSELNRPGPYNTRLNRGLPPTPIGNPGLASIKAAARPAKVSYRFYVVKPGTSGHAFSSTDAQFERDRARYDAARAANDGNSPTP